MSSALKTTVQPEARLSPQQKKLNRLIERIEQQKQELAAWQNVQADIQNYTRSKLLPVYSELHTVLFVQLETLWNHLASDGFSKVDLAQIDTKIAALAKMLKKSQMLTSAQKEQVDKIDTFYMQHAEHVRAKKLNKTELLQKVNEAYAEQDLFYLLKLQLQLDTNKGLSSKPLSSEQVKFYQLSLEAQSQNLQSQLEEIFASFHLSSHINTKQLKMSDVYKVIDQDATELKQQLKWEKERLKHMKKVSGVEVLLGHGVL